MSGEAGAPKRPLAYAAVAFAATAWGCWGLVLRHTESLGPMATSLESAFVMAVMTVVAGALALRSRSSARATWRTRAWLAWGGVGDALNVLTFFEAYKITIAVSVLTHYLAPVLVALAAPWLLRERMTARTVASLAASLAGLAVMLAPSAGEGAGGSAAKAAALGAASAVFYASSVIANKLVVETYSTYEIMFWHSLIATGLLAAFVPVGSWSTVPIGAASFLALATLGPGVAAGLTYLWGLRRMPAAHASTLALLEPVVSIGAGAAVLQEPIGGRAFAGAALILGGSIAVMTARPRGGATPEGQ